MDISKDVVVDNTNPDMDVIHVMIPKNTLIQLADQVNKNGQASTGLMKFTLQPGGGRCRSQCLCQCHPVDSNGSWCQLILNKFAYSSSAVVLFSSLLFLVMLTITIVLSLNTGPLGQSSSSSSLSSNTIQQTWIDKLNNLKSSWIFAGKTSYRFSYSIKV